MFDECTNTSTLSLKISDLNASFDGLPRMQDLRLAIALGFQEPRAIRKIIARHHVPLSALDQICERIEVVGKGQKTTASYLTKKQCLDLCTKSETERATEVTIQMVELFDAYTQGQPITMQPAKPITLDEQIIALRVEIGAMTARAEIALEALNKIPAPSFPRRDPPMQKLSAYLDAIKEKKQQLAAMQEQTKANEIAAALALMDLAMGAQHHA